MYADPPTTLRYSESGDSWFQNLQPHHSDEIKMLPLQSELSFHYIPKNETLSGLSGSYVRDNLRAGRLHEIIRKNRATF